MRPRTHIHFIGQVDDTRKERHAPIAGDDYSPPSIERTSLIETVPRPYREWSREEKQAYIEHLEEIDKPAYASPIQPQDLVFSLIVSGTTTVGEGIGKTGKYAAKAVRVVVTKAIKAHQKNMIMKKQFTVDREQQASNAKSLRDAIDKHHDRMKEPTARAKEQRAIERREHRERLGDTTMNA